MYKMGAAIGVCLCLASGVLAQGVQVEIGEGGLKFKLNPDQKKGVELVPREESKPQTSAQTPATTGYPALINSSAGWPGLPFPRIDALLYWNTSKSYIFYKDEYVQWDNAANRPDGGYPRKIRADWPGVTFDRIDAAVNWYNGKVYLFRGNQYVRFDTRANRVDDDYPRPINERTWPGLGFTSIDAAMTWPNGKVYFFSGTQYVRYDLKGDTADSGYPKNIRENWPGLKFASVDAAMEWNDRKSYLVADDLFQPWDSINKRADE